MTTKDDEFSLSNDKHQSVVNDISLANNDKQYSNLNLNQSHKCPILNPVHSCSKSYNDKHNATAKLPDSTLFDNNEEKLKSWNKSSDLCLNTLKHNDEIGEEKVNKRSKKSASSDISNKSTLSLHISAYESSNEVVSSDSFDDKNIGFKRKKSDLIDPLFLGLTIQNPFEFPRQQNEDQVTDPETTQFRASQRLINPSEPSSSSNTAQPLNAIPRHSPAQRRNVTVPSNFVPVQGHQLQSFGQLPVGYLASVGFLTRKKNTRIPIQMSHEGGTDVKPHIDVKPQPSESPIPYQGAACVICLDTQLKDPTILDCCQHFFCYDCINQWLLTNPSCPMCKKHLNKIKHKLSPQPETFPVNYSSVGGDEKTVEDLLTDYEMGFLEEQSYTPLNVEKRCIEEAIESMYHKTIRLRNLESDGILTKEQVEEKRLSFEEKIRSLTALKSMMNNRVKRSTIYNTPEFRRLVYTANLSPRSRLSPRFPADATSNGIIANEALFRRRLIPFVLRELTAIIPRDVIDMGTYIDLVINYLKTRHRNDKNTVLNKLHSAGIEHPLHFLNNVTHFLSSGQRLEVYDENCEYRVRGSSSDIRSFFQNDSDNDVEFLNETITIGNQRRPLEQWADNMRTEYFRRNATNPPAPISAPQVITIDANDAGRNTVVLDDSDPIILSDDEDVRLGDDDNNSDSNMFAHPDLLLPSSSRRTRSRTRAAQILQNPSSIFDHSVLESHGVRPRSPQPGIFRNLRRSRSPPATNSYRPRNRSPSIRTDDYADLDDRLHIFDGLGPFIRNVQSFASRARAIRPLQSPLDDEYLIPVPRIPIRQPGTPPPPVPAVNNDEPSTSNNATESDSDVEIVSQTSSISRKRPRYDDAH